MLFKIAKDYTDTPGGRYIDEGSYSGELFRDYYLIPRIDECINNKEKLIIDFDGGYGYSSGFLEEAFGGLIRKGYSLQFFLENVILVSEEDDRLISKLISYMEDANRNRKKSFIRRKKNDKH